MDNCVKVQTLAAIAGVILAALAMSKTERDWEDIPDPEPLRIETETGDTGGNVWLRIGGTEYLMSPASAREISASLAASAASADREFSNADYETKAGANLRRFADVRGGAD